MFCGVHCYVTVFNQQIENGNIANQIHGSSIDYGKLIIQKRIDLTPIDDIVSVIHK